MRDRFQNRTVVIRIVLVLVTLVFVAQLANLQLIHNYAETAGNISLFHKTLYAPRGLIYDRNGKLLVYNQPAYDVLITMKEVRKAAKNGHPIDTVELCRLLSITKADFVQRVTDIKDHNKNLGYSPVVPQRLVTQLSPREYATLQEMLYKFPGITVESRMLRQYSYAAAAHALGSIGEVSREQVQEDPSYHQGDYIGVAGVEKQYEAVLRGENGVKILLRDKHGRIQGSYNHGASDHAPVAGKDLTLGLDIDLQIFAESLMQNKLGSVVAIEPATGEILAIVSAPSYDPSLLVGRQRTENYRKLQQDPYKPLLDRPLMARYPPGSTFKTANALVFQQEGIITTKTCYPCSHGYHAGSFHLGCHGHASPLDLPNSIANSCNAYYCYALRAMLDNSKYTNIREAFSVWKNDIVRLGFGHKLGADFPNEVRGYIPNADVYDKIHGKGRWKSLNIVSISIGQGEVLVTPLQLANLGCLLGNRGYWYRPHILHSMTGMPLDTAYTTPQQTGIKQCYFAPVIQGMDWAVNGGGSGSTARIAHIDSIRVCGKTGTAENPHGGNHSVFMCFAPKENPKIAVAVVVENAGYGATWAAPIASLVVEKYLKGTISEQRQYQVARLLNANLMPANKKR